MTYNEQRQRFLKKLIQFWFVWSICGSLMGKRFHAEAFLEIAESETHCCNYLLATDWRCPDGYASTSWSAGYGDYVTT